MAKNITQKVVFKNTSSKALYDLYMNAKKHAKATAAPAKITNKAGTKFSVHGGYITGENLYLINNSLIIQTWRAQEWDKADPDSIFIIQLEQKGKNTILHAIHAGVPDKSADGINKGWHHHYWEPWKKYLAGKPITKHPSM
jgi:activator of HSP90 ATPase